MVKERMIWKKWIAATVTVLWMAVIFSFSAQPAEESSRTSLGAGGIAAKVFVPDFEEWSLEKQMEYVEKINHPIRKLGHATEYAILGACLMVTVRAWGKRTKAAICLSFGIGVLYAVSDEVHQLFVPGRSGQITDVLIDSSGVFAGAGLTYLVMKTVSLWKARLQITDDERIEDEKTDSTDPNEDPAEYGGTEGTGGI